VIPTFYTPRDDWPTRIETIVGLLGRIAATEELLGPRPEVLRNNRLEAIHSSTAIEGNTLTFAQVSALAESEPVFAPPREVAEVNNALAAYGALDSFDPWSVPDFLRAHGLLTAGLIGESGEFRSVEVAIVNADGEVIHQGSQAPKVPRLVAELFEWGAASPDHPLVVASATHYLIEHIHPFRDGNGRIGRLWQTLIMSRWRPLFAWLHTEALVRRHLAAYYQALQASRVPEIDAGIFIDYMLDVIMESLHEHEAHLRGAAAQTDVARTVGRNVVRNSRKGVADRIVDHLADDPSLTAAELAVMLDVAARTVQRHIAALQTAGRIRRVGSTKAGQWEVIDE
jgi:Fic family protein